MEGGTCRRVSPRGRELGGRWEDELALWPCWKLHGSVSSRIRVDLGEVEDLPEHAYRLSDAVRRESRRCPSRDLAADVARTQPSGVGPCERRLVEGVEIGAIDTT